MTEKTFYQVSAVVPLLFPFLVSSSLTAEGYSGSLYDWGSELLMWSIVFGGLPYVAVAGALLWRLRAKPAEAYRRISIIMPLIFAPVLFVFVTLPGLFVAEGGWGSALAMGAVMAVWGLTLGYMYVALVHTLRISLRAYGILREDERAYGQT